MKPCYPTWKRDGRGRWVSVEGRPDSYGKWSPDFVLEKAKDSDEWVGKMRTSAKFTRFESVGAAKTHYETTVLAAVASRQTGRRS